MYAIQQGSISTHHQRKISNFIDESAVLGGLARTLWFICYVSYWFFGYPFRELNLALSYQKLREKKASLNSTQDESHENLRAYKYKAHTGFCFYVKLFCLKRLPLCFDCCCARKQDDEDFDADGGV